MNAQKPIIFYNYYIVNSTYVTVKGLATNSSWSWKIIIISVKIPEAKCTVSAELGKEKKSDRVVKGQNMF